MLFNLFIKEDGEKTKLKTIQIVQSKHKQNAIKRISIISNI